MRDIRNARHLIQDGWKFSGRGNGPLGENYWWPPAKFYDQVPDFTVTFNQALAINQNQAASLAA